MASPNPSWSDWKVTQHESCYEIGVKHGSNKLDGVKTCSDDTASSVA